MSLFIWAKHICTFINDKKIRSHDKVSVPDAQHETVCIILFVESWLSQFCKPKQCRNDTKAHSSQNKQRKFVPKQKPVTILDFCTFIWNLPFCEEKKFVNMKNLAKIMNKGEKKL